MKDSVTLRFHLCYMQILKVFLKPVDERYRDEVNRMKAGKKGKAPYTEKINIHVPSGWYDISTAAHDKTY